MTTTVEFAIDIDPWNINEVAEIRDKKLAEATKAHTLWSQLPETTQLKVQAIVEKCIESLGDHVAEWLPYTYEENDDGSMITVRMSMVITDYMYTDIE